MLSCTQVEAAEDARFSLSSSIGCHYATALHLAIDCRVSSHLWSVVDMVPMGLYVGHDFIHPDLLQLKNLLVPRLLIHLVLGGHFQTTTLVHFSLLTEDASLLFRKNLLLHQVVLTEHSIVEVLNPFVPGLEIVCLQVECSSARDHRQTLPIKLFR